MALTLNNLQKGRYAINKETKPLQDAYDVHNFFKLIKTSLNSAFFFFVLFFLKLDQLTYKS